jgi:hypothetical protein
VFEKLSEAGFNESVNHWRSEGSGVVEGNMYLKENTEIKFFKAFIAHSLTQYKNKPKIKILKVNLMYNQS